MPANQTANESAFIAFILIAKKLIAPFLLQPHAVDQTKQPVRECRMASMPDRLFCFFYINPIPLTEASWLVRRPSFLQLGGKKDE